eukprot:TRINITY_DN3860_c0_g1_i8.p1 TRINITY_DN3860_c0_g1~~TRINITY_DN3860_c0_g1_i8.p1  ORF type:complete len:694 (+),score=330.37 TRINITY_DN3860_c0_g1_i8:1340-3421(+)
MRHHSANGDYHRVFGVPLEKLWQRGSAAGTGQQMLSPLVNCVNYLDAHGLDTDKIFSVSGAPSQIELYREQFDAGGEPQLAACADPLVVASLLKLFLRELPDPVLTSALYDKFVDARDDVAALQQLVLQLPVSHQVVLEVMLHFLGRLLEHSASNGMTAEAVFTVFGPIMLARSAEQLEQAIKSNPQALAKDIVLVKNTVKMLFDNRRLLHFSSPLDTDSRVYKLNLKNYMCVRAMYDYQAQQKKNSRGELDISFCKNDVLRVLDERAGSGWMLVQQLQPSSSADHQQQQHGVVPNNYVVKCDVPGVVEISCGPPPEQHLKPLGPRSGSDGSKDKKEKKDKKDKKDSSSSKKDKKERKERFQSLAEMSAGDASSMAMPAAPAALKRAASEMIKPTGKDASATASPSSQSLNGSDQLQQQHLQHLQARLDSEMLKSRALEAQLADARTRLAEYERRFGPKPLLPQASVPTVPVPSSSSSQSRPQQQQPASSSQQPSSAPSLTSSSSSSSASATFAGGRSALRPASVTLGGSTPAAAAVPASLEGSTTAAAAASSGWSSGGPAAGQHHQQTSPPTSTAGVSRTLSIGVRQLSSNMPGGLGVPPRPRSISGSSSDSSGSTLRPSAISSHVPPMPPPPSLAIPAPSSSSSTPQPAISSMPPPDLALPPPPALALPPPPPHLERVDDDDMPPPPPPDE